MTATGILLALAATVSWAICVFPFTKAARLMSVSSMNLFRLVVGTVLVMCLACIMNRNNFIAIFSYNYAQAWLWLGISGVLALGLGDYLNYRMYVILSPRYGSVLTTLSPAAALLVGFILLHENLNLTGMIGILITIVGVMSMSLGRTERNKIPDHGQGSILKGIIFGSIAALCTGAGLAFSKQGFLMQAKTGNAINPVTGSFIRFISATLIVLLITFFNKKLLANWYQIKKQPFSTLSIAMAGIVFGPVLGVSFALSSIQYINVAVSQTIFALVPIVALIIAHVVYKEKITRHALAGVLLAIAGVAVLIWRTNIQALLVG